MEIHGLLQIENDMMETIIRYLPRIEKQLEKHNELTEKMISNVIIDDPEELVGQIVDIFEDFLTEKKVRVDNSDEDPENSAIIYGSDYDGLREEIMNTLIGWKILSGTE